MEDEYEYEFQQELLHHEYENRQGKLGLSGLPGDNHPSLVWHPPSGYDDLKSGDFIWYAKQHRDYYGKTELWFNLWQGKMINLLDMGRGKKEKSRLIRCCPESYDGTHIRLRVYRF
jgi:hypothetical protein